MHFSFDRRRRQGTMAVAKRTTRSAIVRSPSTAALLLVALTAPANGFASHGSCSLSRPLFVAGSLTHCRLSLDKVMKRDQSSATDSSWMVTTRRDWLATIYTTGAILLGLAPNDAFAQEDGEYENPNMPAGPQERSGLVVLRVAEVAQFQEKILRAVANGDLPGVTVAPQQIVFGTQILLRNSNLDGNLKLMIYNEIPRRKRNAAITNAVRVMNTIQAISTTAARIEHPFTTEELIEVADLYRIVRVELNDMYDFLPPKEKAKYYGYFMAVTEYEKKIAEGTYNPDLDGILQFD